MPHLSPMNWLLMLFAVWSLMIIMSNMLWWSQHAKWPAHSTHSLTSSNTWNWLFKGGRNQAMNCKFINEMLPLMILV